MKYLISQERQIFILIIYYPNLFISKTNKNDF